MTFAKRNTPRPTDRMIHHSKIGRLGDEIAGMKIGDECIEVSRDEYSCSKIHEAARSRGCRVMCRYQEGGFFLVWRTQ